MDISYSVSANANLSGQLLGTVNNLPATKPLFGLDRDKIFYSRAFRRLAGKTQLMAAGKNEVLRTRLTHTLEVSQISRTVGGKPFSSICWFRNSRIFCCLSVVLAIIYPPVEHGSSLWLL